MREDASAEARARGAHRVARDAIARFVEKYFEHNASARMVCEHVMRVSGEAVENVGDAAFVAREIPLDHLAFRSFGTGDLGIDALCEMFEPLGYALCEDEPGGAPARYAFPEKRVRARWMKPPRAPAGEIPLPRIFVSELVLDDCEEELRDLIETCLGRVSEGQVYQSGEWADGRNARWQLPSAKIYARVQRLSEYASWTLMHGYAVNHIALSLFQLRKKYPKTPICELVDIETTFASNAALARKRWNDEGGRIKRSPSGLLLQSSLMAEPIRIRLFKQTETRHNRYGNDDSEDIFKEYTLPGSYIEFVQRLPKKENAGKPFEELEECDLRDGFETANANKIFESTSNRQVAPGMTQNRATAEPSEGAGPSSDAGASARGQAVDITPPKPIPRRDDAPSSANDVIDLT